MDFVEENKLGCIAAILVVAVFVIGISLVVAETIFTSGVRGHCLECGYPDYITHNRNGYCVQVGSMIVPVEEACQQ